ncbi:MAG: F0F1 ATP synthase subunit epsilon [Ruminococcaceae bacterium]|jgi:F-type H+-transporting ATPase subunit epsilon|nr:F0F1 ATP synthase subunit epsilon [Oscillospiraceae bacterium]
MSTVFKLHIYAVDRAIYDGDCVSLTVPITDGQIGVLAHHTPLAAAVVPGKITYRPPQGREAVTLACGTGILRFANNDALVLLDSVKAAEAK